MDNNVKEEKVEEDEETQWTKVKIERKKEKKKIRQLEEQTKERPDPTTKPVPTTTPVPKVHKNYKTWDQQCRNCRLNGNINGCCKMYCNVWN